MWMSEWCCTIEISKGDVCMDYIITTRQLTKRYKNFTSVNNVSLHIQKGSIYGFLGPNGAGKSTTMKMLLGLTAPTKGSFIINGKHFPDDRIAILKEIGSFKIGRASCRERV